MPTLASFSNIVTKRVRATIVDTTDTGRDKSWVEKALTLQPLYEGETDIPVDTTDFDFDFEDADYHLPFIDWVVGKITLSPKRFGGKIFVRDNQIPQVSPVAPIEYVTNKSTKTFYNKMSRILAAGSTALTKLGFPSIVAGATQASKTVTADSPVALAKAAVAKLEESGLYEVTGILYDGSLSDFVDVGTSYHTAVLSYDAAGQAYLFGRWPVYEVPRGALGGQKIAAIDKRFIVAGPSANTKVTIDKGTSVERDGSGNILEVRDAVEEDSTRIVPQFWFGYAVWGPKSGSTYTDFPAAVGTLGEVSP